MSDENPYCFGILEKVFPVGQDGLRISPESCMVCFYKTECLRTAMSKSDGIQVQDEIVDRAYSSGMMNFFQRWSRKKTLDRQKKDEKI